MPIISQFYGIIITMYVNEEKYHLPHIHIRYNEFKEVMDFEGNILSGEIPYKQNQLVRARNILKMLNQEGIQYNGRMEKMLLLKIYIMIV